jgi:hypothetical protein
VAIVHLGELVRVADVGDLLTGRGEFAVRVDDAPAALALVQRHEWGGQARIEDGVLVTPSPTGRGRDLLRVLGEADLWPDRVVERQRSLEEIFLSLTGARHGAANGAAN